MSTAKYDVAHIRGSHTGFGNQRGKGEHMSKAEAIVQGLGGADNIVEIEACITRLRTEVKDSDKVDEAALKAAGAHGVLKAGAVVQVVVGPEADTLAEDIEDIL